MDTDNSFYEEFEKRLNAFTENDMAVFDDLGQPPADLTVVTGAYFLLLCSAGHASCRIGDRVYDVRPNDLFFCQPRTFVEDVMVSTDFKCVGTVVSTNYFESMLLIGGRMWDARRVVRESPLVHLSDEEFTMAVNNNAFMRSKLAAPHRPHRKEMIRSMLQTFAYEFFDILAPKLEIPAYSFTSAESLFSRFMDLAETDTPVHRDVRHYADRLCVTPKYLSAVCRKESGTTASAILTRLTMEYIKRELRTSSKSVKEIAAAAGFDNLSFFGKFVRRSLGMTAHEYRLSQAGK